MSTRMTKQERAEALAEVASVDTKTRMLMMLVMRGLCPFCLGDMNHSPTLSAIRRGLTGEDLKIAVENAKARDVADGIDSDTGHALGCVLGLRKRVQP